MISCVLCGMRFTLISTVFMWIFIYCTISIQWLVWQALSSPTGSYNRDERFSLLCGYNAGHSLALWRVLSFQPTLGSYLSFKILSNLKFLCLNSVQNVLLRFSITTIGLKCTKTEITLKGVLVAGIDFSR
jgi:hypothetical protein